MRIGVGRHALWSAVFYADSDGLRQFDSGWVICANAAVRHGDRVCEH